MIKKIARLIVLISFSAVLTGCWESSDVTFHEPGKYFGASDSLKTDAEALQTRLEGQRDR
ncbi:MAG: hypothetical protein KTR18_10860 [Acidiferrobacterales bacterium]|nr:hypothetical protein [Acidiferrobacterales bacterium]